ncbi:MAG: glycosyltransferase [Actinomycetota bacterium]|nr:glycosyltransferase [Actinomycetota bacterium]
MAPTVCFVSFRLGHADGVSVESAKWARVFRTLGFRTSTVAGAGEADQVVPGLAIDAGAPPTPDELDAALADADLVVVENVCSLPLNRPAAEVLADRLRGRPAVLHHHDFPWQQEGGPEADEVDGVPPDDPKWVHVTINWLSQKQLADKGIEAMTIPNCFDTEDPGGDRDATRARLGIAPDERLVVQPTRAIPRKNVPAAVQLARAVGAAYWLVGPAEDGYGAEVDRLLAAAEVRVIEGLPDGVGMPDAYAAADAVALPSRWEGFGNPTIESAIHRRPLAVGRYPVAREIAAYGFRWFPADEPAALRNWLDAPDPRVLDVNQAIARRHFSMASLEQRLAKLVHDAGWAVA